MSLAAVVSQLDLSLRESRTPVQELGEAIARISAGLTAEVSRERLQREVSRCLEALQFYDRHTQHLSHLLDFMSGMTATMDSTLRGEGDDAVWEQLRTRLRRRLVSDQQRALLDLLLPPGPEIRTGLVRSCEPHADPGSIELF